MRNDLKNGKVGHLVLSFAIPTIFAQLINVLYGIIDRMFIGHIPLIGDTALAGVGVCSPIITLLTSFGTMIGLGGSIMMATTLGLGDKKRAKQILANSFLSLVVLSVVLTAIFLGLKSYLIDWFGGSPDTAPYANTYLSIYTIGLFFALMSIGLNSFIICQGFSFIAMITVIIGAFSNIILDAIFVAVLNLGVAGAAWATVISQMFSCIFVMQFLFGKKTQIRITFHDYSLKVIWRIIKLGFSPFLILASDSAIIIVVNSVLQRYGGPENGDFLICCATIVQSYFLLITAPLLGISSGTQPIISYNNGAGQKDRVIKAEKYIALLGVLFTSFMFLVSRFAPAFFIKMFTDQPDVIEFSIWGIKTFTLAIVPLSLQYVYVDGLTALEKVHIALPLSMCRKAVYTLFACILPIFMTAKATFYAEPLADIISASISTVVFLTVMYRYKYNK